MKYKNNLTLASLVIGILAVIFIFSAGYAWMGEQATAAGDTIDPKYTDIYNNLQDSNADLRIKVDAIGDDLEGVSEADNTFQVAWNGLKGLGNTLKLTIGLVSTSNDVFEATQDAEVFPAWIMALIVSGLIAVVVFLILANLKGESKMI